MIVIPYRIGDVHVCMCTHTYINLLWIASKVTDS